MTHHREAHFDDSDNMFLPPQRTLGFNPQLKLNDSVLAQSYVEAYDIGYPEAIRRIEAEVSELKQHLENEGFYELNDIGRLSVNGEGKLEFEPCEAGILTPELYGLSSFEMVPLKQDSHQRRQQKLTGSSSHERAITIQMSWVRNAVAVAAALLAFLMMNTPVSNSLESHVAISQVQLPLIAADTSVKAEAKPVAQPVVQEPDVEEEAPAAAEQPATPTEEEVEVVFEEEVKTAPQPAFTIVLASQVTQQGAEDFVNKLKRQGIDDVRIYKTNKVRRVVCGTFATEAEARQRLQAIHETQGLSDAWLFKIED